MDIDLIKSCKATMYHKTGNVHNITFNTELLRYFKNSTSTFNSLYNNYINDLFKKTTVIGYQEHTDYKVYLGTVSSLPNVTRNISYLDENKVPEEFKPYLKNSKNNKEFILCSIQSDDDKLLQSKIKQYPKYYIDTLFSNLPKELYYLIQNEGYDFFYEDDHIKIFPDFVSKPFHSSQITSWNSLKKYKNITDIRYLTVEFLQQIEFVTLLKDTTLNTVFKLNLDILKSIKQKIINFYKEQFFIDLLDKDMQQLLDVYVNTDTKYDFTVVNFSLSDKTVGHSYTSFIDMYRRVNIDELIQRLENNEKLVYFTRVNKDDKNKDTNQIGGNINKFFKPITSTDTLETLFKTKIKTKTSSIKVLNTYSTANRVHSYCSEFLLVQIENKSYEISVKSVTYEILKQNTYNNAFLKFKQQFIYDLTNSLKSKADVQYTYDETYDELNSISYYFTQLPAVIQIYVKEVPVPKLLYKHHILEKATEYYNTVLPTIQEKGVIVHEIVLRLSWRSEFRRLFKHKLNIHKQFILQDEPTNLNLNEIETAFFELTKQLLLTPSLGIDIFTNTVYSDNFIIENRMFDNNLKQIYELLITAKTNSGNILTTDMIKMIEDKLNNLIQSNIVYEKRAFPLTVNNTVNQILEKLYDYINDTSKVFIVWYCPNNLLLKNYNSFTYVLKMLNSNIKYKDYFAYSKIQNFFETDYKAERDKINSLSNFYDMFSTGKDDFCYNVRHLTDKHKAEIDLLLESSNKLDYFSYVHYYNNVYYNVFHLHIYPKAYYGKLEDKVGRYFDNSSTRKLLWDKDIRYVDYSKRDIMLQVPVEIKATDVNNKDVLYNKVKDEFMRKSGRYQLLT